ncbi:hypothetical protein BLOT_009136 [Blomia tropicalis]|nr:hypothetical protein BLOT_009136 [Blomia tropicalis]
MMHFHPIDSNHRLCLPFFFCPKCVFAAATADVAAIDDGGDQHHRHQASIGDKAEVYRVRLKHHFNISQYNQHFTTSIEHHQHFVMNSDTSSSTRLVLRPGSTQDVITGMEVPSGSANMSDGGVVDYRAMAHANALNVPQLPYLVIDNLTSEAISFTHNQIMAYCRDEFGMNNKIR